jgi:hypothetical protein
MSKAILATAALYNFRRLASRIVHGEEVLDVPPQALAGEGFPQGLNGLQFRQHFVDAYIA